MNARSRADLGTIADRDPVGLVAWKQGGVSGQWLKLPLLLRDFATGGDIATISISGENKIVCPSVSLDAKQRALSFLGLVPAGPGGIGSVSLSRAPGSAAVDLRPFPPLTGGLVSMLSTNEGKALLSMGPTVTALDSRFRTLARVVLGAGDQAVPPASEAMWAFSAKYSSFVVAMGGMSLPKYGPNATSRYYVANLKGVRTKAAGSVAGIVPDKVRDEWTVVLRDGSCRTYRLRSGHFATTGRARLGQIRLAPFQGEYDRESRSLYDITQDGRLAWISFKNTSKVRIRVVAGPKELGGALTTFAGSRWVAIAAPETATRPASITWFKKQRTGEPVFRFVSRLEPGQAFVGICGPDQQARL
ncbi:MAG: hypothetical protein ACYC96_04850 [Fimbriimonadaceae bacterium]